MLIKEKAEDSPLVSICLITYNHEKYIRQSVDSILSQQMNFSYELIIADDASTDGTQQILRENYGQNSKVRLILREKNTEGKNTYLALQEARGKYIYNCEGDDFWIGNDGLSTLVDWLESHEDYVGVCGRRLTQSEKTEALSVTYDKRTDNREISLYDFWENKATFDLCAILYRNFYHDGKWDYRYYVACPRVGDLTIVTYILLHGKIFQLDKVVGVYRTDRIRNAGAYNTITSPREKFEEHLALISNLPDLLSVKLNYSGKRRIYAEWYISSFASTYEFIRQIPYLVRRLGIRITFYYLKKWVDDIRK